MSNLNDFAVVGFFFCIWKLACISVSAIEMDSLDKEYKFAYADQSQISGKLDKHQCTQFCRSHVCVGFLSVSGSGLKGLLHCGIIVSLSFDKNNGFWDVSSCVGAVWGQNMPDCSVRLGDLSWDASAGTGHSDTVSI